MVRRFAVISFLFVAGCAVGLVSACGSSLGGAIPIEQYKEEPGSRSTEYVIGVGDMLGIQVFDQVQMSSHVRVRTDGRVSLPLLNEIIAAGKTPSALAADIEGGLKSLILNPKVTVVVEDSKPLMISVMGEVGRPGPQPLERDFGVAQALAAAGGLSNFAHRDRIFVVRATPKPIRIHFTYDALTRKLGAAAMFRLQAGDIVIVE
jgi:polysaccharide export outer membrane protein